MQQRPSSVWWEPTTNKRHSLFCVHKICFRRRRCKNTVIGGSDHRRATPLTLVMKSKRNMAMASFPGQKKHCNLQSVISHKGTKQGIVSDLRESNFMLPCLCGALQTTSKKAETPNLLILLSFWQHAVDEARWQANDTLLQNVASSLFFRSVWEFIYMLILEEEAFNMRPTERQR